MCIAQNSCPNLLPSWSKLLGGGNRGQDVGCQLWSNWRRGRGDTQGKLPYACWQQPSQLLLALVGWEQSSQAPQLNWKPHHDEEEVIAKKKITQHILFSSLGNTECIYGVEIDTSPPEIRNWDGKYLFWKFQESNPQRLRASTICNMFYCEK